MSTAANADMEIFWNGEGGDKWVRLEKTLETGLRAFGDRALAAARPLPGEIVLDIGCGCGPNSIQLADQVGQNGSVLGVDISQPILAKARSNAADSRLTNVTFNQVDVQTGDLGKGKYDLAFSRFGVMFFDQPVVAFRNVHSALKTGGRLAFACWGARNLNAWVEQPLQVVARHIPLPTPPAPGTPGPFSMAEKSRVVAILTEAGFQEIEISSHQAPLILGRTVQDAIGFLTELSPSASAINAVNPDQATRKAIADDLAILLEPLQTEDGVVMGGTALMVTANKV